MYDEFEDFYYEVRYVKTKVTSSKTEWVKINLDFVFTKDCLYVCVFLYCCNFHN